MSYYPQWNCLLLFVTRGGGVNTRSGMSHPLSVPQKMFTFDNNVPPNTDFGETSLFGGQQPPHVNSKHYHGGSK